MRVSCSHIRSLLVASQVSNVVIAYVLLFGLTALSNFVLININFNLVATSALIIYIGSYGSLENKIAAAAGDENAQVDVMTAQDAYMFPIMGSCTLFGLYCLFNFVDKSVVNLLLGAYFGCVGLYTLTASFDPVVATAFFSKKNKKFEWLNLKIPFYGKCPISVSASELLSCAFASVFTYFYFKTKHWTMNNLFGIAFAVQGIKSLSVGSYKVGCVLLCLLFIYDIFWVFGSDVMVTVAKSFDAPIKLLFPRAFAAEDAKAQFSMLGLGDIVIPGIFVALLLRFDAQQAKVTTEYKESFPCPYFIVVMFGYIAGLITTVLVMYKFEAAQPALLYLVPSCIISSFMTGLRRGEFKELFAFKEESEEDKDAAKAKASKKTTKKKN
jgi:minor histocompatibility antigen H13